MDREGEPGTARFGNFINYYSFNPADRRIQLLPKQSSEILDYVCPVSVQACSSSTAKPVEETTHRMVMLDVGSNAGDLTTAVFRYFSGESLQENHDGSQVENERKKKVDIQILGVDIDAKLVERSNENNPHPTNLTFLAADLMNNTHRAERINKFLESFQQTSFHLTLCFSVTLWIHLNHGDQGLKDFLRYISSVSKYLLIEPQPWKCYRTAVRRMKKLKCEPFKHFPHLLWRENVDEEILNFLTLDCGMVLKERFGKTEWDRSICLLASNKN